MKRWGSDPSTGSCERVPIDGMRLGRSSTSFIWAIAGACAARAGLEVVPPADGASNHQRRADW